MDRKARTKHPWLFESGDMVDHFRVVRPIGRGGMAEVYLARDTTLGRKVALKVIQPDVFESADAAERFLLEARTTAQFNHPHIVTIHTVGQDGGRPYLALEYLEGETLRERMLQERPGSGECLRWVAAIADALAEAHSRGVLHRDLKPENVFLPKDGRLRVLDFGLARIVPAPEDPQILDFDTAATRLSAERAAPAPSRRPAAKGSALRPARHEPERELSPVIDTEGTSGTPAYMAPEQWRGRDQSGAADVWALGLILYELLVGHRPYARSKGLELIRLVCGPDPVPAPDAPGNVATDVLDLMMRCLAKATSQRPSAAEVKTALNKTLLSRQDDYDGEANPFRGLLPFNERHRHMFFGRDSEIGAFVERLRDVPVLAIVGPSGAGKSSFVRAGIIPRLREGSQLTVVALRPGSRPFHALAKCILTLQGDRSSRALTRHETGADQTVEELANELALSPSRLALLAQDLAETQSERVLIFVDQMEELYTLAGDPAVRGRFLRALVAAADDSEGPVRVILTVREEFLSRLAEGPELRQALAHITILRSPDSNQLREILARSVSRVGYAYDDPHLVDRMVDEVEDELSCLPLLQFAGQKLWEGRDRDRKVLLASVYEGMGGVGGALATHADGVLAGLSIREVGLARTILLRLVTPDGTRRVRTRSQVLQGLPEAAVEVLDRLVGARLITVRRSTEGDTAILELVHESLLVAWNRLARWLEGSHEEREFLEELMQAAELWRRRGHRADELWQGEALREAEATVRRLELDPPGIAGHFLGSSRRRENQRARRRRFLVAGVFTAICGIAVMLGFQRHEARSERDRAERQREAAERGQAEALREGARSAWLQGDIFEARCKLRRSLEILDSTAGRVLWWQLEGDPLRWQDPGDTLHFQVAVSENGALLATSGAGQAVSLFDTQTRAARLLTGHEDATLGVAFSPDGRLVAAGTYGGDVLVWSLADGQLRKLVGHTSVPWYLIFTPHGDELVSGSYDGTIRIWNVATGTTRATLAGHEGRIRRVRLSSDGRTLASGSYDGTIRLWDLPSASHLRTLVANGPVLALAWRGDGSLIVSGGSGGPLVQVWDPSRGEAIAAMDVGHSGTIESLDFSPNGRLVASGSRDWTVRVWDVADGTLYRVFDGHEGEIHVARFSPDGEYLAVTSADKGLRLWNLEPPPRPSLVSGHTEKVYRAVFSPDGRLVATSSEDDTVRLWDTATGEILRVIAGHASDVFGLAFSPDGEMLVTTGADRTARLWAAVSGELLRVLRGHQREVVAAEFAPDGRHLATASVDGTIRFWNAVTGAAVAELDGHNAPVVDLSFSPDGRHLASAGYDGTIRLWDTATRRQVRVLSGHTGNVYGIRFEPDSQHILSTSHDRTLRRWNTATGASRVLETFDAVPYFPDVDREGRWVAVPLIGGEVVLLDRVEGRQRTLATHGGGATGARFSPDGSTVATTGGDGALLMWTVTDGRPLWRAPVLLTNPLLLFSHMGWRELAPKALEGLPVDAAWRSAVETSARRASQSEDGGLLCLVTWDDVFELWDVAADTVLFTDSFPSVERLIAVPGGCIAHTADGRVRLVRSDAIFTTLGLNATAVGLGQDEIFVAADNRITAFTFAGERLSAVATGADTTAVGRVHDCIVTGGVSGVLQARDAVDRGQPPLALQGTPPSPVTRIAAGPAGTVVAGFGNGQVALWDLTTGAMLMSARLHGEIIHLAASASRLVAATELGQSLTWDLETLVEPRPDFLRRVRTAVPAIWENGRPVAREYE